MVSDYEPTCCVDVPLERRAKEYQEYYLPDIERATGGEFSISRLLKSGRILDIGCGGGSLAHALRKLGYRGKLVGVDAYGPYSGDTAYKQYERLIWGSIQNDKTIGEVGKFDYDTVVGVGLPPQAVRFMLGNKDRFRLKRGGQILIASDNIHPETQHFNHYSGQFPVDRNIFLYSK